MAGIGGLDWEPRKGRQTRRSCRPSLHGPPFSFLMIRDALLRDLPSTLRVCHFGTASFSTTRSAAAALAVPRWGGTRKRNDSAHGWRRGGSCAHPSFHISHDAHRESDAIDQREFLQMDPRDICRSARILHGRRAMGHSALVFLELKERVDTSRGRRSITVREVSGKRWKNSSRSTA